MLPLGLGPVVGIGYTERQGFIEMSRCKHDCILVLLMFIENMKEENGHAVFVIISLLNYCTLLGAHSVYLSIRGPTGICLHHAVGYQCVFSIYVYKGSCLFL